MFQTVLKDAVIDPGAVRFAGTVRTHYAVAAAVASGRAQLGFGAKMAAKRAGLHFRKMAWDRMDFLVSKNHQEDEGKETFFSVLKSEDFRCSLPAGILMNENAGNILKR
jgi:molybdate-binding protein